MFLKDLSIVQIIKFALFFIICLYIQLQLGYFSNELIIRTQKYPRLVFISLFIIKILPLIIAIPYTCLNVLGTFLCGRKPLKVKTEPPKQTICFRVVTRGMFPQLIRDNMGKNLSLLKSNPIKYTYEVVSEVELGLGKTENCYEIVVPSEYQTKNGSKYKARALQYSIERNVCELDDDDWVVHLDEETLLTESSINGIIEFINRDKHQIGQGGMESN